MSSPKDSKQLNWFKMTQTPQEYCGGRDGGSSGGISIGGSGSGMVVWWRCEGGVGL